MTRHRDRAASPGVSHPMGFSAWPVGPRALVAIILAMGGTLVACGGGKNQKGAAEPGQRSADGRAGDRRPDGDTGAGGEAAGGESDTDAGGPPGVRPPGLDLPPAEKQRRVAQHLKRGEAALDRSNDPDLAVNEAKAALAVDEASVDAMVLLAQAYYVKGYYDLVQDVLEKALERGGSGNKKLHFLLGLIHDRNKRDDKALDSYQKAVAIDPSYRSGLMNLGVHLLRNKRFQEAVSLYERLTGDLKYRTAASLTNLGSAYRGLSAEYATSDVNRRNQLLLTAERTFKAALVADRNYADAYYNTGLLYLDADPFPEGRGEMDLVKRLQRAKGQFDEYRRLPGADQRLADEQVSVAQKLIDKEERARQKAREREAKRKAREAKDKAKDEANGQNP